MFRSKAQGKRINVHIRSSVKKTLGRSDQWPISYTLWGSALSFKPLIVDWEQNQSVAVLWKLTFSGEHDFSVSDTRFSRGGHIWEPISVSYIPADTQMGPLNDTLVECKRIDKLI